MTTKMFEAESEDIMSKVCEFMDTSTTSSLTLINLVEGVVGSNIEDFIALYSTNKDFVLGEEFGVDVLLFKGGVVAHITNHSEVEVDKTDTGTILLTWEDLYQVMGFEYTTDEEGA